MKIMLHRILPLLLCLTLLFPAFCQAEAEASLTDALALDMTSDTLKQEVTVKAFVDGDTTHFYVPEDVNASGVLKARYLGVDTPESTGKIEEYGKAASRYTREKLESAESIIIESDNDRWNLDSTGDRYLVWVWYQVPGESNYRNLNVELLEQGLAIAKSAMQNRYGETCMAAIAAAKEAKRCIYSGQPDPDFYYGDAIELTLQELRCNPEAYNGMKVAFSGIITMNSQNSVYIESYDPATDRTYGISVYYGFGLSGTGLDILSVGNESRIVGTVQYYEAGGTWQVSGLSYRMMKPDDPGNIQKISEGHAPAWTPVTPAEFASQVTLTTESGDITCTWAEAAMATSVSLQGLAVTNAVASVDSEGTATGALTLTCEADGVAILIRALSLDMEPAELLGKTISVQGIVDLYDGQYQVKVFSANHVSID